MKQDLFKIMNLTRFFGDKQVLDIPEMILPKGEIICVVGESGCGKTTFLELLGLMTHPSFEDHNYLDNSIKFLTSDKTIDYREELWYSDQKSAEVRRNNFSFLFQQANLLPGLNVYENVVVPSIIRSPEETLDNIHLIDKIFDEVQISHRKYFEIDELSVGQKQRSAFARSVFREHSVLFADEPTGNLDPFNSRTVFELIQRHIRDYPENSAIIVTHNIDLAIEFSDRIAALSRNGFCDQSRMFYKEAGTWYNEKDKEQLKLSDTQTVIESLIQDQVTKHEVSNKSGAYDSQIQSFEKFFGKKVKNDFSLIKKNKKNKPKLNLSAFLIMLILTMGFIAIGFANGSLTDLAKKMADPFVNWLDVELTDKYRYQPDKVINKLQSNSIEYNISQISRYSQFSMLIQDHKLGGSRFIKGRTISLNDEVLEKLTSEKFKIKGIGYNSEQDIGLIVTESFFEKFGYHKNSLFINMIYNSGGNEERLVPIPIKAIVKELPGDNEFLSTDYFKYELYHSRNFPQPFNPLRTKRLLVFAIISDDESFILMDSLESFIARSRILPIKYKNIFLTDPQQYNESYISGNIIPINFGNELSLTEIDDLFEIISKHKYFAKLKLIQFYQTNFDNRTKAEIIHDRLSINLNAIDNVYALKEYLLKEFNIQLDVARVELLNNFYKVKKITIALSWTIIFFVIFSINVFVFFYLYINLYKQRIHLGSLKAFGLTSTRLSSFYLKKMLLFLAKILLLSLIASFIAGYSGLVRNIWILFTGVEAKSLYFNMIDIENLMDIKNLSMPLFIILLFVGTYISLKIASSRILKYSPGDLVKDMVE